MQKLENIEKILKCEELGFIYLFFGEETYLIENALKKIKNKFGETVQGINYIYLDDSNVQNLISEISVPAFGYQKKLVIIKNANIFKKETKKKSSKNEDLQEKIKDYLQDNIDLIKDTCILVFVEQDATKNDLFEFIDKNGVVCNFEKLKPNQLVVRLKSICNAYKVNVNENVLMYLIENIGTDMQDAINEIRKLIEYTGEGGTITKEAVDALCIKQTEAIIWDLTDFLGNKNIKSALENLQGLIYNKEPIQKLLTLIYNHFKKLYLTKLSEKYNKPIAECLSLKPNQVFLVSKYKKQSSYFNEETLRKVLESLIDLDANYKLRIDRLGDRAKCYFV